MSRPIPHADMQAAGFPEANLCQIDPTAPDPALIAHAATLITCGGVVVFPTQCLYGLGANALNAAAVARLFTIKRRRPTKPILILIGQHHQLSDLVTHIPAVAHRLMQAFWPGSLTLVLNARPELPEVLTAGTGTIGIRMAGHPVAQALLAQLPNPITGTSANLADQPGCHQVKDLPAAVSASADYILDAGPLKGGTGSTVIDVTTASVRMLREGLIPAAAIAATLGLPPQNLFKP